MIKLICLLACLYTVLGAATPTPWIAPVSTSQPCTFENYNLSPMTLQSNAASNYQVTDAEQIYYLNVCANVINGGGQNVCTQPTPSCQKDSTPQGIVGYPLGSLDYQTITALPSTINNGTGVQITYAGGPANCGTTQARTSILQIQCNPNAGQGSIASVVQAPTCVYTFTMSSKYACPGSSGGPPPPKSGGGVAFGWIGFSFMLTALLLVIVYIAAGMAWNYKRNDARGLDMIPNLEFWKDFPFLFRDGWILTIRTVSCGKFCAGYSEI